MSYVDGFIIPVKKENVEAYRQIAEVAAKVWIRHGALDYKECVLDDSKESEWCTTFEQTIQHNPGETIIFSYIVYKDREHRDEVNAKVMTDPELVCDRDNMPFDLKRMAYGGFKAIVEGNKQ